MSWSEAIRSGCNPSEYSYKSAEIISGRFTAKLDFKIWAKEALAICCYFTIAGIQRGIQLTVYCSSDTGRYTVKQSAIDFVCCPVKTFYEIDIIAIPGRSIIFQHCEFASNVR